MCVRLFNFCVLRLSTDPYVDVGVVWLPIIIIIVITLCILCFVVVPLFILSAFKSHERHEEKLIRRDTLRLSRTSRSRSVTAARSAAAAATPSASRGSDDVKRRRPPMSTTVLDISGVTLDESTVDDKRKMMFNTSDWSTSSADVLKKRPIDESSYDDSDLGPVHRSHASAAAYPPPRRPLENEIATVGGRNLYGPAPAYRSGGFFNEGYLGDAYPRQVADSFDDRSIEARFAKVLQSASDGSNGVPGSNHGRTSRPRPQLSTTSGEPGASYPSRRRPRGDAYDSPRPTDSSGTATGTGASSAASRTKRPRPKINEF